MEHSGDAAEPLLWGWRSRMVPGEWGGTPSLLRGERARQRAAPPGFASLLPCPCLWAGIPSRGLALQRGAWLGAGLLLFPPPPPFLPAPS